MNPKLIGPNNTQKTTSPRLRQRKDLSLLGSAKDRTQPFLGSTNEKT